MSKKNFSSKFLTAGAVFAAAAFGLKKLRQQKNPQTAETPETTAAQEVEITETAVPAEDVAAEAAEMPVEDIPEREESAPEVTAENCCGRNYYRYGEK